MGGGAGGGRRDIVLTMVKKLNFKFCPIVPYLTNIEMSFCRLCVISQGNTQLAGAILLQVYLLQWSAKGEQCISKTCDQKGIKLPQVIFNWCMTQ